MTKGEDLVKLVQEHGPPPHIIWVRCGNTSNEVLRGLLRTTLPDALVIFEVVNLS